MILMRLTVVILALILFCSFSLPGFSVGIIDIHTHVDTSVQDITLQDDAFHGRGKLPFIEWWYFDARFNNGYSLAFGVQVVDMIITDVVTIRLTIYDRGDVVVKNIEKYSLLDFSASTAVPSVRIDGQQLIIGAYENLTERFVYTITYLSSEVSFSLHFKGCMKGWKRQQQKGDWWAVILPRADVTGTISIGSETLNVTGSGYHDHNWLVNPRIVVNFGWLWGTCHSSTYTITWAEVCPTRITRQPILVVNEKDGEVLDIPTEAIWYSQEDIHMDHLRLIPLFFNIETMTEKVFLVLHMKVVSVDYTKLLGFISYWRYHIQCNGTIIMNGHMETIEGISIMEYLRFR